MRLYTLDDRTLGLGFPLVLADQLEPFGRARPIELFASQNLLDLV
jgi:hypothetical protein